MKVFKCFSAVSFIGAILMTGCTYSEIQPEEDSSQILQINQITAYNGDSGTKTVLANDKTSILWKPNDKINVFYGSASVEFTSMNTEPEDCTIFTSSSSIVYGGTESSSSYIWAVYPYSSNNTHDKTSVTLTVPSSIAGVPDSFANGSYPAIGRSKDTNIAFYNVCGGICFTVTNDGVRAVTIRGNNNEDIAGKVKVGFDENEKPIVTEVTNGDKYIRVYNNTSFQVGTWYYIPMLPVNLANGFTMRFEKQQTSSGTECATLVVNSPYEVKRAIFGQVENADNNLTYRVNISGVSFSYPQAFIETLSQQQLNYNITPSAATYDSIEWTSSDESVATVDQNGIVTGVSEGTCTITLRIDNVSTSCSVYVSSPSLTTAEATSISYGSAVLNGSISAPGINNYYHWVVFRYSKTSNTVDELVSSSSSISASSSGEQNLTATVRGLEPNTTYYYIADCSVPQYRGTSSGGTTYHYYGSVQSFTTSSIPPLDDGIIDLGLSVKWSSTNVGADSPEEIGDLYSWGEVSTKAYYGYGNYKWWDSWETDGYGTAFSVTKYGSSSTNWPEDDYWVNDGLTVLELEDDVARVEWRGKWRMPTKEECQELINNCSFEQIRYNNVNGYLVTSNVSGYTDKRIFLPLWNNYNFWSSSVCTSYPINAYAISGRAVTGVIRSAALPVRPVKGE